MYQLAFELAQSKETMLYELGHYLADNIILKIGMIVAKENQVSIKDDSFPGIYRDFIIKYCKEPPSYSEIDQYHKQRNMFQHKLDSIEYSIKQAWAIDYVRKAKEVMISAEIIDKDQKIPHSNFIKGDLNNTFIALRSDKIKISKSEDYFGEDKIKAIMKTAETKFEKKVGLHDLDIRILSYPMEHKESLYDITEELRYFLERNIPAAPTTLNRIFKPNLEISRSGLYHISTSSLMGGSILIKKDGMIIYNWHRNQRAENRPRLLPKISIIAYSLGFLDFLYLFYTRVDYIGEIKIIFKVKKIKDWKYSWIPDWLINENLKEYKEEIFEPIEKDCLVEHLRSSQEKISIIKEIFGELLLGYSETEIPSMDKFEEYYKRREK